MTCSYPQRYSPPLGSWRERGKWRRLRLRNETVGGGGMLSQPVMNTISACQVGAADDGFPVRHDSACQVGAADDGFPVRHDSACQVGAADFGLAARRELQKPIAA